MKEKLFLHVPALDELWYRERLMSDPDTMAYNKGYDLPFEGYDRETGCIAFPREAWAGWYACFVGREPLRYYAYIVRERDGAFLGEVNLHKSAGHTWHDMGIVLEARYRGQRYSVEALRLLLRQAFEVMRLSAVHNNFETSRSASVRAHLSAGFSVLQEADGILEVGITREQYALSACARGDSEARMP